MTNKRYERHLNEMRSKGWDVQNHSPEAVVDENFAQFYSYFPHNDDMAMSTMSVDRFIQLRQDIQKSNDFDFNDPTLMANSLCEGLRDMFKTEASSKDVEKQEAVGLLSACYMCSTTTGQAYFSQAYGRPFAFLTILYPSNKKLTDFYVRPALQIDAPLLAVEDVRGMIEQVMEHDKAAGKKQFFKYLKKKAR